MSHRLVAATLSLTLAIPTFSVAPAAQGSNCAQIAERFDRETKAFVAEAEQKNIGFLHNQMFAQQTEALKTLMEDSTQGTTAANLKEDWDKAKANFEKVRSYEEALRDLYLCAQDGSPCNMSSFLERVSDEIRQWLDPYTNGGLAAVRERALEAANLIRNYMERVTNISTGTMTAMEECTVPMKREPRVDPDSGSPVPSSASASSADGVPEVAEPPSKPVDPPANGEGGSNAMIWGLAGAAGVGYGVYQFMPSSDGGGSGTGGACTRPTSNPLTICSSQGGSSTACQTALAEWGVRMAQH
jgi:hypothetical protein